MRQLDEHAWPRIRQAGVCLHLTSLPGKYGIGEIGATARGFIDDLVAMQLRVWQFLPTGPTGFGDSPYQPLSSFAGNEMLIDVAALVQDGILLARDIEVLECLPDTTVDFARLIPKKAALLELAARRFARQANPVLKAEFADFLGKHDTQWLNDYAMFRILKSRHAQKSWIEWQAPFRHRDSEALHKLASSLRQDIQRIKIGQFLFYRQWQQLRNYAHRRNVLLFGDLPIYVAADSADAWASRELLCIDREGTPQKVAGVPPDYFSRDGQLWGNPLYDWKKHSADNYRWWIDRLRHATAQADLLRIDHFRAFESYWAVRHGAANAREGEWLAGPGDALFDAVRKSLGHLSIVAEDLGVITPVVDSFRRRHAIPGMKVLQFEVERDDFDIADIGDDCVCYTGTHDNDTTVGWFLGAGSEAARNKGALRWQKSLLRICNGRFSSIHRDLTRLAFSSAARLAVIPMQDYLGLGSEARLNTPGTAENNWRWRLQAGQIDPALLDAVGEMVAASGRSIDR